MLYARTGASLRSFAAAETYDDLVAWLLTADDNQS
jgi:hypothetical protein